MILCMSHSGEILPIAYRMMREGQKVSVYMHSPAHKHNYDGIVDKVKISGLKAALKKADLVIFDITRPNKRTPADLMLLKMFGLKTSCSSVFGPVADKMKQDSQVIGCSKWCEDAELDRMFGYKVAKQLGLKVPESHEFRNFQEGAKFLTGRADRWILKPQANDGFTYLEMWPGELLTKFEGEWKRKKVKPFPFVLQKVIYGIEISTEAWFDGRGFLNHNHTIEDKVWLSGNWGEAIGSQNNIVWRKEQEGLLTREIEKLKPILRESGYIGPIDLNCIVNREDHLPYFLEFSPRMGYDAIYCLLSMLDGEISTFFYSGFRGKFVNGYCASQRITIKPFPYATTELLKEWAEGVDIRNPIERTPWFWMEDVKKEADGTLVCGGADGILGVVTAVKPSVKEAADAVYDRIKKLRIGSKIQVRTDLGNRAERAIPRLQEWGLTVR